MVKIVYIHILMLFFSYVLNAQYIRDDESKIVFDTSTMLVWEDPDQANSGDIKEALDHCKDLEIGHYHNWRLPSYNELYSIVDLTKSRPALHEIFKERSQHYYWTSTLYTDNYPWSIDFTTGANHYNISPVNKNKIRCVHSFF